MLAQDEAAPRAPPSAQGTAAGSADAGRGTAMPQAAVGPQQPGTEGPQQQRSRGPAEPNPLRSLGDALEHWRASLAVSGDAQQVLASNNCAELFLPQHA